jgi:hypothetical protein
LNKTSSEKIQLANLSSKQFLPIYLGNQIQDMKNNKSRKEKKRTASYRDKKEPDKARAHLVR